MANTPGNDRENPLFKTWHDATWMPILNQTNVMDYFAERSNTFYDRTCNNEIIKMQRLPSEALLNMPGVEYILLHVQEPILYIIRKQHRYSPTNVSPLADYYISGGVVYQAPDLCSVISSRLLNTIHNLESAFTEAQSFSRYHPSKGYWWELKDKAEEDKKSEKKKKEEPSSMFQRQRVDDLLVTLAAKFPPPTPAPIAAATAGTAPNVKQEPAANSTNSTGDNADGGAPVVVKTEPKTEPGTKNPLPPTSRSNGPPPEKKTKLR